MSEGDLRGKRYGEVLLVHGGADGPEATVYNTYPLNDCPEQLWSALDADALAKENGALAALLNGPRYWLMNSIEKAGGRDGERKSFGGIEMLRQATVRLASMNPSPYAVNSVDRKAVFVFDAGQQVYELTDTDGRRWVMQTYSQITDPTLDEADLPGLADRLHLPDGWAYRPRTLDVTLRVDTSTSDAHVLQDDLTNSYSLQTS
jgi:hypothetical protein